MQEVKFINPKDFHIRGCGEGCGHGADCELGKMLDAYIDRTLMLQRFIGMAQERTWPALETINEARVLLGMHELKELPFCL